MAVCRFTECVVSMVWSMFAEDGSWTACQGCGQHRCLNSTNILWAVRLLREDALTLRCREFLSS
jgi:hypothetical protein